MPTFIAACLHLSIGNFSLRHVQQNMFITGNQKRLEMYLIYIRKETILVRPTKIMKQN